MIRRYLEETGQLTPEMKAKLDGVLHKGYQKLLTFQNDNGSFGWWEGGRNSDPWLTAYAVEMLDGLKKALPEVDDNVTKRALDALITAQKKNGSFGDDHRKTGYIVWVLSRAGHGDTKMVAGAAKWLMDNWQDAKDVYQLALVANALLAFDPKLEVIRDVLARLEEQAIRKDGAVHWTTKMAGYTNSRGVTADIEATALAALALEKAGDRGPLVDGAATAIVRARMGAAWGSTQATVLALRLLSVTGSNSYGGEGQVRLLVNGTEVEGAFEPITAESREAVQSAEITPYIEEGNNEIVLVAPEGLRANFRIGGRYHLPWGRDVVTASPDYDLKVTYDKEEVAAGGSLSCRVEMKNTGEEDAFMVVADVAIPPGFTVDTTGFDKWIEEGTIAKWSRTGRTLTFYLDTMKPDKPLVWSYRLQARYPAKVVVPRSVAYEYYSPERRVISPPQELRVKSR